MNKSLFWADQLANEIVKRKHFYFTEAKVPKLKKFVVKSAASVSGVLHIGRLSDTIRCDAVFKALKEMGYKASFIWIADNVDPLRKVPKGIPKSYVKYIGTPVTDIPDPFGCHKSYEEHYRSSYLEVVNQFIHEKMKTYSMREEYLKGTFSPYIKKILKNSKLIVDIQNKYRKEENKLGKWYPWKPVCEKCGKIITTRVTKILEDDKVEYTCQDYRFKTQTAKGCGYKGVNDPAKGNGKLLYKSELATQWAHWKVVTEGFGKEYQVPGSAFWINGEIIERVFKFPMPKPIFYEHLMVNGVKISASLGNVIYPEDWLKVAPPELLRFFYNKKLMKTRSFSWEYLPNLYDDYDWHEAVFFGKVKIENKKEREHAKRLYEVAQIKKPKTIPVQIPFDFAAMISQVAPNIGYALKLLKSSGHVKGKLSKNDLEKIKTRLNLAKNWLRYAPEQYRFEIQPTVPKSVKIRLTDKQKEALKELAKELGKKEWKEKELYNLFWIIAKRVGIKAPKLFEAAYQVLLNRKLGPRLAPFILVIGRKKVARLLKKI